MVSGKCGVDGFGSTGQLGGSSRTWCLCHVTMHAQQLAQHNTVDTVFIEGFNLAYIQQVALLPDWADRPSAVEFECGEQNALEAPWRSKHLQNRFMTPERPLHALTL
jgi:hypothetical protein